MIVEMIGGLTPVNNLDYPRPHHKIVPKILK